MEHAFQLRQCCLFLNTSNLTTRQRRQFHRQIYNLFRNGLSPLFVYEGKTVRDWVVDQEDLDEIWKNYDKAISKPFETSESYRLPKGPRKTTSKRPRRVPRNPQPGTTGPSGPSGPSGPTGPSGPSGPSGTSGTQQVPRDPLLRPQVPQPGTSGPAGTQVPRQDTRVPPPRTQQVPRQDTRVPPPGTSGPSGTWGPDASSVPQPGPWSSQTPRAPPSGPSGPSGPTGPTGPTGTQCPPNKPRNPQPGSSGPAGPAGPAGTQNDSMHNRHTPPPRPPPPNLSNRTQVPPSGTQQAPRQAPKNPQPGPTGTQPGTSGPTGTQRVPRNPQPRPTGPTGTSGPTGTQNNSDLSSDETITNTRRIRFDYTAQNSSDGSSYDEDNIQEGIRLLLEKSVKNDRQLAEIRAQQQLLSEQVYKQNAYLGLTDLAKNRTIDENARYLKRKQRVLNLSNTYTSVLQKQYAASERMGTYQDQRRQTRQENLGKIPSPPGTNSLLKNICKKIKKPFSKKTP